MPNVSNRNQFSPVVSQFSGRGLDAQPATNTVTTTSTPTAAQFSTSLFEAGQLAGQRAAQGIVEGGCYPQPAPQQPQNLVQQLMALVVQLMQMLLGRLGGQQPQPQNGGQAPAPTQGGQAPAPTQGGQAPAPAPAPVDPAPAQPAGEWKQGKHGIEGKTQADQSGMIDIPGYGQVKAPEPGKKEKIKIDKKKYIEVKTNKDGTVEVKTKKKGGFFSKLGGAFKKIGGFLKKALPIITTVASFIPGLNAIAIPLKIATTAMNVAGAIKNKNWLGAIGGIAGGVAGAAGAFGATKLANVAGMISKGAGKAEALFGAIKSKSPSGILGAAAGMLQFGSQAVGTKSAEWSTRLNNWAETAAKWGKYAGYVENPQGAIQDLIASRVKAQ